MGWLTGRKVKAKKELLSAERYLEHLVRVFGEEPELYMEESRETGIPGVTTMVFRNIPEPGYTTVCTYGLSLVEHPNWKFGKPELCLSVKSDDASWGHALSYLTNHLRGSCPFSYGQTIHFGESISSESGMNAFLIFAPSILEKTDYLHLDVGMPYTISIAGVYPIYAEEMEVIRAKGIEAFWNHPDFDLFRVDRIRITG